MFEKSYFVTDLEGDLNSEDRQSTEQEQQSKMKMTFFCDRAVLGEI